jgi:hypothetical protein
MDVNYLDREVQELAKRLSIFASSSDFEFAADETADHLTSSLQALTTSVSTSVSVPKPAITASTLSADVSASSKTAVPINPFAVPVNPFAVDNNSLPLPPPRGQAVNDDDFDYNDNSAVHEAQKQDPVIPERAAATAHVQSSFEYDFGYSNSEPDAAAAAARDAHKGGNDDDDEIDLS